MNRLTELIRQDMKPALGVTEPGAIAFAAAKVRESLDMQDEDDGPEKRAERLETLTVRLNSGMYKNGFTCGIPNSDEYGNLQAAALGYVCGRSEDGLFALEHVAEEENRLAAKLIEEGRIEAVMDHISSSIYIRAELRLRSSEAGRRTAAVTICGTHTGITEIEVDGEIVFQDSSCEPGAPDRDETAGIHGYSLKELLTYIDEVTPEELRFIAEAHEMNAALCDCGLMSNRTKIVKSLYAINGEKRVSADSLQTAQVLCSGAIEARVIGLNHPAMTITGSGAHGILCTMPLYGVFLSSQLSQEDGAAPGLSEKGEAEADLSEKREGKLDFSEERLQKATALSYLITMYIKEYSGRLSAYCGCGIAAGTGAACGLVYLRGGGFVEVAAAIDNMAAGITGMICDGGNLGCVMKGIAAVDAAFRAAGLALQRVSVDGIHGICGDSPEKTMKNMGLIASPGMVGTEKTIIDILQSKMK